MANNSNIQLKQLLCPYLRKRLCKYNPNCPFAHDLNNSIKIPENVCWFYLRNNCMNGSNCSFIHLDLKKLTDFYSFNDSQNYPQLGCALSSNLNQLCDSSKESNSSSFFHSSHQPDFNNSSHHRHQLNLNKNFKSIQSEIETNDFQSNSKKYNDFDDKQQVPLCPFALNNDHCPKGSKCTYTYHGTKCDICSCLCLHPFNLEERKLHENECKKKKEKEARQKLLMQSSLDKVCGICMEPILEKSSSSERRFGILEKCDHVFCLSCIRQWRKTEQLARKIIRSCPECRVFSSFVIPSKVWYSNSQDKKDIIKNYKQALSEKPCKYFNQGKNECPFGGACFYLHAYPDGSKAKMPFPRHHKPRLLWNNSGFISDYFLTQMEIDSSPLFVIFDSSLIPLEFIYDFAEFELDGDDYIFSVL